MMDGSDPNEKALLSTVMAALLTEKTISIYGSSDSNCISDYPIVERITIYK